MITHSNALIHAEALIAAQAEPVVTFQASESATISPRAMFELIGKFRDFAANVNPSKVTGATFDVECANGVIGVLAQKPAAGHLGMVWVGRVYENAVMSDECELLHGTKVAEWTMSI